jgi:uncharacterized membrane protein YhaH (DUF805 family)
MDYIINPYKKCLDFSGRSTASEYWYFVLFNILSIVILFILNMISKYSTETKETNLPVFAYLMVLIFFINILPIIALAIRRLHDVGKSGTYILFYFVPFGGLYLLLKYCEASEVGENKWGLNSEQIKQKEAMDEFFRIREQSNQE